MGVSFLIFFAVANRKMTTWICQDSVGPLMHEAMSLSQQLARCKKIQGPMEPLAESTCVNQGGLEVCWRHILSVCHVFALKRLRHKEKIKVVKSSRCVILYHVFKISGLSVINGLALKMLSSSAPSSITTHPNIWRGTRLLAGGHSIRIVMSWFSSCRASNLSSIRLQWV